MSIIFSAICLLPSPAGTHTGRRCINTVTSTLLTVQVWVVVRILSFSWETVWCEPGWVWWAAFIVRVSVIDTVLLYELYQISNTKTSLARHAPLDVEHLYPHLILHHHLTTDQALEPAPHVTSTLTRHWSLDLTWPPVLWPYLITWIRRRGESIREDTERRDKKWSRPSGSFSCVAEN